MGQCKGVKTMNGNVKLHADICKDMNEIADWIEKQTEKEDDSI